MKVERLLVAMLLPALAFAQVSLAQVSLAQVSLAQVSLAQVSLAQVSGGPAGPGVELPPIGSMTQAGMGVGPYWTWIDRGGPAGPARAAASFTGAGAPAEKVRRLERPRVDRGSMTVDATARSA